MSVIVGDEVTRWRLKLYNHHWGQLIQQSGQVGPEGQARPNASVGVGIHCIGYQRNIFPFEINNDLWSGTSPLWE